MRKLRQITQTVLWLLPASSLKNALLRSTGHAIHSTALARASLVWSVERFSMSAGSRIGRGNIIKNMRQVTLDEHASIGRLNVISSHPVYAILYRTGAAIRLGKHAKITSRHSLDCSGSIDVGEYAAISGHATTILTHSVSLQHNTQAAYPVKIGRYSFVGTHCVVLGGANLPGSSVLGAGSVLTRSHRLGEPGLWAGSPAKHRGDINGAWFHRNTTHTRDVFIPETGDTIRDAF